MKAVILAANPSKKLSPFAEKRAKSMLPICGSLILDYTLNALQKAGIREIMIVVNHHEDTIREKYSSGDLLGLHIEYTFQKIPKGIGNAIESCKSWLKDEPFLLIYGDIITVGNPFFRLLNSFSESGNNLALITLPSSSNEFGNVYLDSEMRISKLIEKPIGIQGNYVFAGVFLLQHQFLDTLEKNKFNMSLTFEDVIKSNKLKACLWEEGWIDMIYPWHILEANSMLMKEWKEAKIDKSVKLKGQVQIEGPVIIKPNVTIESGSVIKGPCFIGQNTYIGNNVLLRSNTVLGPESIIGYGCELKNTVTFGKNDIGRLSFLGDTVIGERTILGSGLTTVNRLPNQSQISCNINGVSIQTGLKKLGAFIGDEVQLGARHTLSPGTMVPVGKKVPDNITL